MGILNATPDSFSDGGRHLGVDAAVAAGVAMVRDGAAWLDVDCVDALLAHQPLRLFDPGFSFVECDGNDVIRHPGQVANGIRLCSLLWLKLIMSMDQRAAKEGRSSHACGQT